MYTDSRSLFLHASLFLLLHVEFSLSGDFDVTTIYNFQKTLNTSSDDRTTSVEVHARNNARGLPFVTEEGTIFDPNLGIDIETCTYFDEEDCNWTLSNFSRNYQNAPLNLQGKYGRIVETTIKAGKLDLQPFTNEILFTFYTKEDSDTLQIYLMDSSGELDEADLYYFTISNRNYAYYNSFYRCSTYYGYSHSEIRIAGYKRRCRHTSQSSDFVISYWQRKEYTFSIKIVRGRVTVSFESIGNTKQIFAWTDDNPIDIRYYAIGTAKMAGSFKRKLGPNENPIAVLTKANGLIESEPFNPRHNEVCVSVVYYTRSQATLALQIVKVDGSKLHFKQLQTSSLGGDWVSSIYSAQLQEEKTYGPVRIQIIANTPAVSSATHNIGIQRITGCNSQGLEEDIYVVLTNKTVSEMDLYGFDVAVNQTTSNSEELRCLNGGLFDNERNSCICPAGFIGKTCELGCGADRYDSKCSGRCSKTKKGCKEMKLCRPKLGCNCAPGLKGDLCDTECSSSEYGASCKQKCGNCIYGTCDIYTGHCTSGCQEGFYPPFCQTHYKHLITPPKVTSIDYHTLQVTFSIKPEDVAGSGTPKFYQFQIREEKNELNTWSKIEPVSLPAAQSVESNITHLKPGTNYEVRVILLDIDGNTYQGKDVPVVNGFTKCIIPNADYKLHAAKLGQKEFQIKWEYSAENILWCKVTHFEVDMKADWKWKLYYEGAEKVLSFSDLLPGEKYEVRVRGISVDGPMPFSEPLTVITQDEAPWTVSEPLIVSRKHNQIEINWKEPFSPRGNIEKYRITYKCQKLLGCNKENCSYFGGEVEVRKPSVTLQGLIPHAQYLISIAAKSALYGPYVQVLATTEMAEPEVPPSPSSSTIAVRTNSTLTVQWEPPENCTYLNGYLYGYQYELFEPKNPTPLQEGSTDNTSTTFNGLNPHSDYVVKVYLKTSGGVSSIHPLIINASTRATVPGKVEQLTVYKVGRRIIGLRWASPKETYGDIRSFTVSYRSEHQQATSFILKPARCIAWPDLYCHSISSLRADTEYTVTVQARNKEVNEDGEIAQVVATTKESAPLAPDYIKTVSQTETSLTIEWGLPNLVNGVLRSFLVNIEETDSVNSTDCCQYFPIQEVAVRNEQASYRIQLNNLKPASTYAISVTAKTMALGPAVSITDHTRPQVPTMDGMLELVDSGESSELSISSSPKLNIHSSKVNKDVLVGYLLVVIPQSASVSLQETSISNEWLAQELDQKINSTYYIAAELNQGDWENDPAEVVLGKENELKNGKWSLLWNPELENNEQYRIGLVAILEYCGILNVGYNVTDILTVSN